MSAEKESSELTIKLALLAFFKENSRIPNNTELAKRTGLSRKTIERHVKNIRFDVEKTALSLLTPEVIMRLYQRATGYSHRAVKIFYRKDDVTPTRVRYTEHYPPDQAAAKLWMQVVEGWSEKIQQEHSGEIKNSPPVLLVMKRYEGNKPE